MRKSRKKKPQKNYLPLVFLIALFMIIIYAIFFVSPKPVELGFQEEQQTTCAEGLSQSCYIGNCTGLSNCINGRWGPCKLDIVCHAGEKVPCLEQGCVNGYRECNECGTAFGQCVTQG